MREQHGGRWLENALKDVRYGFRILVRAPGFAFAAVVSLALGIGANTAMFSVVDAVMLRPLPYPDAGRLITLWSENRQIGLSRQPSGYSNIADWRNTSETLTGVAVYAPGSLIEMSDEPRRTSGLLASPELAEVLRLRPQLGRLFTAEEAARRDAVVVLSHDAWQQRHAGAAGILGRRITIGGRAMTIMGVMPEIFYFPDRDTEFWMPHTFSRGWDTAQLARGVGPWRALARLAPGVALADGANAGLDVRVVPLAEIVVGRDLRRALALLGRAPHAGDRRAHGARRERGRSCGNSSRKGCCWPEPVWRSASRTPSRCRGCSRRCSTK